jgi:hypothetical protein
MVEPDRPPMTIWRMRLACWVPKATDIRSEYVTLSTATMVARTRLCVTLYYIACIVNYILSLQYLLLWKNKFFTFVWQKQILQSCATRGKPG